MISGDDVRFLGRNNLVYVLGEEHESHLPLHLEKNKTHPFTLRDCGDGLSQRGVYQLVLIGIAQW